MEEFDLPFETYSTQFPISSRPISAYPSTTHSTETSRRKSSVVPGATQHVAIRSTTASALQDDLISFLSYVKTHDIPILPVTKPDIRTVLGQGASFLVNGAEVPETYIDPVSGTVFPQGMVVALKRAVPHGSDMSRIRTIFNELLTMHHPPLRAHPNIVKLLGIGFETEGPSDAQNVIPVLIPECAELGNLAEVLETARKEDRPLAFDDKMSLCLDIAHGLEILHACDIVHGDVKCENILIFETDDESQHSHGESRYVASRLRSLTEPKGAGFNLYCKLTDFGVLRHPDGIPNAVLLGGSLPWQAPECSRGHFFEIEEAKRTDVYSFGMLLWRVFLDGDPFKLLGEFEGKTNKEKRQRRNDAVAALKEEDNLVKHVCDSLALSGNFSRVQLEMLCELVSVTLVKDSSRRELDMGRIIRLMTPNNWFEARHPAPPCRMPMHFDAQLLDIEKWHSEFDKASPVVQEFVAFGFREYAEGNFDQSERNYEEKRTAAAYQLAICYANEFGVSFKPDECLKWLVFAAERGSQKAQEALPKLARAFNSQSQNMTVPITNADDSVSLLSSSWASESDFAEGMASLQLGRKDDCIPDIFIASPANDWTYLSAAENCRYDILDKLLSSSVKPTTSKDGVSPLHFLSSWDVHKAEALGRRLINAGADINAQAKRGATIGGSPLQWSVYGNHLDHSLVLLKLGADPMAATGDGHDALSFAAKLHLVSHLRLLLENVRPAQVRGNVRRLIEAAAGGESRFTRMLRHEERWTTAAAATLRLIKDWNTLFSDAQEFNELLLPAIQTGLRSDYGRMNSDVQIDFIESNRIDPSRMNGLLRDSILSFDVELFDALLNYGVHPDGLFERGKTLLHLCAKIPDHILAATAFAPRLIDLGAAIDVQDNDGITPWMDAILERKWDLADLLMRKGANPLITNSAGFNVLGLCIIAVNLGSIKYLMKYCGEKDQFHHNSFLANTKKQISTLQLASSLPLPRAHGMKLEVLGTFLTILANFAREPWQLNFRSNGILPDATALDIAVAKGNVHAVKNLVKKGAHSVSRDRATALALAKKNSEMTTEYLQRKNLERCVFIIENWDNDAKQTRKLADDWTNMRTIDESHVKSSWEIVVWHYKERKGVQKAT